MKVFASEMAVKRIAERQDCLRVRVGKKSGMLGGIPTTEATENTLATHLQGGNEWGNKVIKALERTEQCVNTGMLPQHTHTPIHTQTGCEAVERTWKFFSVLWK